jgi:hypothetical protein
LTERNYLKLRRLLVYFEMLLVQILLSEPLPGPTWDDLHAVTSPCKVVKRQNSIPGPDFDLVLVVKVKTKGYDPGTPPV